MTPTQILKDEHRVIEQVLNCLEKMIEKSLTEKKLDATDARDAVAFFRGFADKCHHAKEEERLFPLMESRGIPRQQGPIGVMLFEHEEGRGHVRAMEAAVEAAERGNLSALLDFAHHGQAYIGLLRQHIEKEDHCLFSMADQVMSPDDQAKLLQEFERLEREEAGAGLHEKYLGIAARLSQRYGVAQANVKRATERLTL